MKPGCELCGWLGAVQGVPPTHPNRAALIAELDETAVFLSDNQGSEGWCVLVLKEHEEHLAELALGRQTRVFAECARVAAAIRAVFPASGVGGRPPRINYECLGNLTHHIHWHVIPRHATDPMPRHTVWVWPPERQKGAMPASRRAQLIERLRDALTSPAGEIEPLAAPGAGGVDPARAYRLAAVHAFLETHDMACYRCRTGLGGSTGERCPTCGYDLLTMVESVPAFARDCPLCGASIPASEVKLCWSCGAVNPRYLEVQIAKLSAASGVPATHCLACGYDLVGIRDGVCPECGVPIGSSRA